MDFFTTIDDVFQELFQLYGETEELISYKEKILDSYTNEDKYKAKQIYQQIKPRLWTVNQNGELSLINN